MKMYKTKQYIDKDALVADIERLKADALQKKSKCKRSGLERILHQIGAYNKVISLINTLEMKKVDSTDAFIEKVWDWIEDNILSSNQQDKSLLYYEQFKKYLEK